ncbi:CRISPR-associated endonuclease Cas2 [Phormidium sp. CCY1219]|uniref:CRISPR-associated endonuclease Cas2 n=1 Tax=Phormidium sp. CCY1219 TaxID=2886104 RepID=UPI002D1F4E53|nr:CRISPR-associated endonuclease Cas2 [Phormidium sp. CCY1219]MEB3830938.1 CRISPR-associated endonuclease Cas2 [Phormidium sp. CCY1219]
MTDFWLVCYDLRDNKRRNKLAKLMEQRCQRVQYSVFECPLEEETLGFLMENRWLKVLDLSQDSLRAYPLNQTAKKQAKIYGSPPLCEPPDYLIF